MTPRLCIFDLDGTLADTWPWFVGVMDATADRFGLRRLGAAEAEALRGEDGRAALRALGVPTWRLPAIAAHIRREALAAPPPPLFPGVPDMLRRLAAAGVTLAVATSNTAEQLRRALGPELDALVRHRATDAALFGKGRKLRRILAASGLPPAAAIAIGDEVRDLEAAREAGITAGAVAWGFHWPSLLAARGADVVFHSPEAIVEALAG